MEFKVMSITGQLAYQENTTGCHQGSHVNNINAIKSLNFVRCNLNESIPLTYLGLIRPKIKCTSTVWDPCLFKDITTIERVQEYQQGARG